MGKLVLNGVEYIGGSSGGGSSVMPNSPISPGEVALSLQTLRVDGDVYRIMPGATVVEIAQADYNHLSESQKKDGSIYMVQDSSASVNKIYYMDTEYATNGGSEITTYEDTITTNEHGWWAVKDKDGNLLDPETYLLLDVSVRINNSDGAWNAYGFNWFIDKEQNEASYKYLGTIYNINTWYRPDNQGTYTVVVSYRPR